MKYYNILIVCNGFIGDGVFQSSVFKGIRTMYTSDGYELKIHVHHPLQQVRQIYKNNRYIDFIHDALPVNMNIVHDGKFHTIIHLPHQITQEWPVTLQMQHAAGIPVELQELGYDINVSKYYERSAVPKMDQIREVAKINGGAFPDIVIGAQNNWKEKSFLFTREQYDAAVDVPYLGFGGAHRDTEKIIWFLSERYNLSVIPIGLANGIASTTREAQHDGDNPTFSDIVDQIKACDYFIGSEGGLSNVAAGVGTKCIITTDFIEQLYGRNGVIRQIERPAMGPATYFPEAGHIHLDAFLTDEEVATAIYTHIALDNE